MNTRIVITGMGCISPLGNDVPSTWAAALAGRSGAGPITLFDASEHETRFAAEVKGYDAGEKFGRKEARRMDRYTQFAMGATAEALAHAGLTVTEGNRDRVGVFIGTGIGGIGTLLAETEVYRTRGPRRVSPFLVPMMLPDAAGGQIAISFGMRGPNLGVSSACATGTNTLGEAAEVIRRGAADVMLAGGAEAAILSVALAGFNSMNAVSTRNDDPQRASRPFDKDRDGFVAGEGAAIMVLESEAHALARGATIYGEVLGYGVTNDAYHVSAPLENGAGAVTCMRLALAQANLRPQDIDYLNAHGTSTYLNDKSETAAVKTVFGEAAYDLAISSTKSMTGHLLGAAGALEAIFALKALNDGILPPTINYETPDPECDLDYVPNTARRKPVQRAMSNSFGFGGHNACIILGNYAANGH
ncbi:MAG: beta-ketoacyl-ACP synthase II [Anaerolineales bacterium]|nr:beta-ketoacyl-ACP synthase II [Anaerolineales bacterium]